MRFRVARAAAVVAVVLVAFGCHSNISVPDKAPAIGSTFSMVIAADPQYPWWNAKPCNGCTAADCQSGACDKNVCTDPNAVTECEKRLGGAAIREQIQAAAKISTLEWPAHMGGTRITAPVGVIVNGDLTAFFHKWQVEELDKLVGEELDKIHKTNPNHSILKIIPFLGLGNHDYRNNVCDCRSYPPHDYNICARMAAHMIYQLYDKKYPWIRFNPCSLGYSWSLGKIRFVQMHLWPGYTADFKYWLTDPNGCKTYDKRFSPDVRPCDDSVVFPSWDFLESELTAADVQGERGVLLFHDPHEYWSTTDLAKFKQIVARHNVIAVFAGHYHGSWGVRDDYAVAKDLKNKSGGQVPLILSGAADSKKFVIAEFTANSMKAAVISTADGTPTFETTGTPQYQTSW